MPPPWLNPQPDELRVRLQSDADMERFMNIVFGRGKWVRDEREDVWIATDDRHVEDGKAYLVIRRGGDWFKAVVLDV